MTLLWTAAGTLLKPFASFRIGPMDLLWAQARNVGPERFGLGVQDLK
jgi:hypothetical protein